MKLVFADLSDLRGIKNVKLSTAAMLLVFVAAFMALICLGVGAADDSDADATPFTVDNIVYTPTGDNTACVTGNSLTTLTDVVIPSTVEDGGVTYTVTAIGDDAFLECYKVKSVIIPDSVTSIGRCAFDGCICMVSATIGNGVTSIGEGSFSWCDKLSSVTIPDSVTFIDRYAFEECEILTEIIFNAVNCSDLTDDSYIFGDSGDEGAGINVIFGDGVTKVPAYLFTDNDCPPKITSVTLGINITSIGTDAFKGCTTLKTVYNRSLIDIVKGSDANGYIAYYADEVYGKVSTGSQDDMVIKFNDLSKVCILSDLSSRKANYVLTDVTIKENSYQFIGFSDDLFKDDTEIRTIVLGDGFTAIKDNSFFGCTALTSVTFGKNITSIGSCAFGGCTAMDRIIFNAIKCNDLTDSSNVFVNAGTSSTGIYVIFGENVTYIPAYLFFVEPEKTAQNIKSVEIGNSVTSIGNYAFCGCKALTSVIMGNKVETIGNFAFRECKALTFVTISDSVTSIGSNAFIECTSLASVTISDSVTSIGSNAFSGCTSLASVTIGNKVETIGMGAFDHCAALTSVTIPDSVKSISGMAFKDCSNLASVTVKRDVNASMTKLGTNVFKNCSTSLEILVPANSLTDYKAATNWSTYASNIFAEITECTVLDIEDQTYNREQITPTVTVKNGTTVLTLGTDYTVTYGENFNAGTGTVTITGAGSYKGSVDKTFTIVPKELTVTGTLVDDKFYDGNVTANVVSFGILEGVIGGDEVTISAATGEYDNKSVGSRDVTVKYTLSGKDAGNYTAIDYDTNAMIYPKEVTVSGIAANNRGYDGTTSAELNYDSTVITGLVAGDDLTVTAVGTFSDKTVGTGKTVSISNIVLDGADVSNYTLASSGQQTSTTADITAKAVTVSDITANNKEYDGNTSAVLDCSGAVITGIVGTDVVTVSSAVGTFSDVYIGTGKTVTISNIVLAGADAGNYVLASTGQQTSTTAHITGTVKFQYENTAKAADDITLVDSVPVNEPTLPLTENKIVAGWYNGNVLWNFADKIKVSMTLTVKISEVTSGAAVIQADDKKAVDVELKSGITSVTAILSDGTVAISDLSSTARLKISVEKDAASEDKFDVTVKLGDAAYTEKPIAITLQYDKVKGVPNVYYYPASGDKVKMDASVDSAAGTVTFTTTHNSVYGIEYTQSEAGISIAAIVLCIVMDILIVLAIAVYFVRHRN